MGPQNSRWTARQIISPSLADRLDGKKDWQTYECMVVWVDKQKDIGWMECRTDEIEKKFPLVGFNVFSKMISSRGTLANF